MAMHGLLLIEWRLRGRSISESRESHGLYHVQHGAERNRGGIKGRSASSGRETLEDRRWLEVNARCKGRSME